MFGIRLILYSFLLQISFRPPSENSLFGEDDVPKDSKFRDHEFIISKLKKSYNHGYNKVTSIVVEILLSN